MAYKLLGKTVWRAGRWYVRRHYPNAGRNLVLVGGIGLLVGAGAAAFAAQRRSNGD